jgi:hypothetical protein
MDASMNNGPAYVAQEAAQDEVVYNLQQQMQQMANTLNQQTQRAKNNPRVETITTRLLDFNGKSNVDIWIKKLKWILADRKYPKDCWTSMVILSLKDAAKAFWFNLLSETGANDMAWQTFKQKLMDQFNYTHKQYDARLELQFLKYTTAKEYINKFKRLAIKLPSSKMTEEDKKFQFTVNLPGHLWIKVLSNKCDTINDLCQSLREHNRLEVTTTGEDHISPII